MIDHFDKAWQQVTAGMRQDLRINLLFEHYTVQQIVEKLEDYDTEKILKSALAEFSTAELENLLPAEPPNESRRRPVSRFRDFTILALGGLLWEKLRALLNPVILWIQAISKSLTVPILAAIGLLLVIVGGRIIDSQRASPGARVNKQLPVSGSDNQRQGNTDTAKPTTPTAAAEILPIGANPPGPGDPPKIPMDLKTAAESLPDPAKLDPQLKLLLVPPNGPAVIDKSVSAPHPVATDKLANTGAPSLKPLLVATEKLVEVSASSPKPHPARPKSSSGQIAACQPKVELLPFKSVQLSRFKISSSKHKNSAPTAVRKIATSS